MSASQLTMVLDVSGSMQDTYSQGHARNIAKKAVSASLAITKNQSIGLWTFGNDSTYIGTIDLATIARIDSIHCTKEGTNLSSFIQKALPTLQDKALVIILTDDDEKSIKIACNLMKNRPDVFWQIIGYGNKFENIKKTILNIENISFINLIDYSQMSDDLLLKSYIEWKIGKLKE